MSASRTAVAQRAEHSAAQLSVSIGNFGFFRAYSDYERSMKLAAGLGRPVTVEDVYGADDRAKGEITAFLREDWQENPNYGWVWLKLTRQGVGHKALYAFRERRKWELLIKQHYNTEHDLARWVMYVRKEGNAGQQPIAPRTR